ncbi:GerAB/ArcD/ProY family transporter [Paenibacillus agricola]|uniref:GerAB/ArcD/ProY family transporter n=1 Tax=Paenibacillus agricola TaxID=2716264 RepID=A0ABX0JL91_9BACL|nr:GerAB/ArcD/ProY family transporter [Paenibacillus agricola]NHN34946.1 GerAB/ArcD/ProY family transporter [Paenibacillus agricola]
MKALINERFQVSPFFCFFLITSAQVGIEMAKFQRNIAERAGYDAWMSIILCGLSIHFIVWMMYRILHIANDDLFYINPFCFGKWCGGVINIFVIVYFLLTALISLRSYIETIQVWMFPLMKTWQISFVLLILIYYIVTGGFRVITGMCFWGLIIAFTCLFPVLLSPLSYVYLDNLLPFFNHPVKDVVLSSKLALPPFLGFECLLLFYPLIKNPERSQIWAQCGILFTSVLYLILTLITFVYFNQEHLKHLIWPVITFLKIVELPFIERFEYIVVSLWCLAVLPRVCLSLWGACRGTKRFLKIKQHFILLFFLIALFILCNVLEEHRQIQQYENLYSNIGFCFVYVYIPLLFVIVHIRQKFRLKK